MRHWLARWFNRRGAAFHEAGDHRRAVACFRRALAWAADYDAARFNLGLAWQALGESKQAEAAFLAYLERHPQSADAWNAMGLTAIGQGNPEGALSSFRRAVDLAPDNSAMRLNLAQLLMAMHRFDEALRQFLWLLEHHVDMGAEAYAMAGNLMIGTGRYDDAGRCLMQAVTGAPHIPAFRSDLATFHLDMGEYAQARHLLDATDFGVSAQAVRKAMAMPMFPDYASEWIERREECLHELTSLQTRGLRLDRPELEVGLTNFKLAYHGVCNREMHTRIAAFYRSVCPDLTWTAPHVHQAPGGERLRLGVVSAHLQTGHSVGRIFGGMIESLSRGPFDVTLFHVGPPVAGERFVGAGSMRSQRLTGPLPDVRAAIAAARLDVLLYTDIGMDALTYFLAFSRLAPLQVVSVGHPDTTGIDTIDHYLSFLDIELEGASHHYSEKLVLAGKMPLIYPAHRPAGSSSRTDFGLPEKGRMYACLQTPFKFHPDFDAALAEILDRDADGWIVMSESEWPRQCRVLLERLRRKLPEGGRRLIVLPRLDFDQYLGLLACCDVLLDTWHFGGGNTIFHGFAAGVPTVTWPGTFMRGRAALLVYRHLGVDDFIAANSNEYAALAVRTALDEDLRRQFATTARERIGPAFTQPGGVTELEQFLVTALAAARERNS